MSWGFLEGARGVSWLARVVGMRVVAVRARREDNAEIYMFGSRGESGKFINWNCRSEEENEQ